MNLWQSEGLDDEPKALSNSLIHTLLKKIHTCYMKLANLLMQNWKCRIIMIDLFVLLSLITTLIIFIILNTQFVLSDCLFIKFGWNKAFVLNLRILMLTHSKLLFHFMSLCSMELVSMLKRRTLCPNWNCFFFFSDICEFSGLKWLCTNCDWSVVAIIQLSLETVISDTAINMTIGSNSSAETTSPS